MNTPSKMMKKAPDPASDPKQIKAILTETFEGDSSRLELERMRLARIGVKPSELALIAATLARNDGAAPSTKLNEAVTLILDADNLLHQLLHQPIVRSRTPFKPWLAQEIPTVTDGDHRQKRFFEYLTPQVREIMEMVARGNKKPSPSDEEVRQETQRRLDELNREGIKPGEFAGFKLWWRRRVHNSRVETGRMGGIKKKENAAAKAKRLAEGKERKKRQKTKVWQKDIEYKPLTPDKAGMLDKAAVESPDVGTETLPE